MREEETMTKWMIKLTAVGFFLFTGTLLQTVVLAQDWGPCTGEIQKYCANVKPGGGEVARCLGQHKADLSNGCQSRLSALTEQVKEADEACQDDIMLVCGGVEPGGGRVLQCLKDHQSWLSFDCKVKLGLIGFVPQK
jgi:hypothetical protein